MTNPTEKRAWFDGTINLPTIFSVIAAAATVSVFGVGIYNGLEHRVTVLEQHDNQTTADKLEIKQGLDKINDKLDKLKDTLMANSAGNRSDMQRWSK